MIVNYSKLKKQIKAIDDGYRFMPTEEQEELFGIYKIGSKKSFMKCMVYLVKADAEFYKEFAIN